MEREKLRKLSSITIIDYIREQIQILMQMKCEEDKEPSHRNKEKQKFAQAENGAASEFASSFQSIDLPPKEYEQQLQQYESDVRNHIRAEQQLKLHIEVLQEKIDDFEKEKDRFEAKLAE